MNNSEHTNVYTSNQTIPEQNGLTDVKTGSKSEAEVNFLLNESLSNSGGDNIASSQEDNFKNSGITQRNIFIYRKNIKKWIFN